MTDAPGRPLRILSLAPTSFFNDYGCHVRILEEARALTAAGHTVDVLTYFKGNTPAGVRVIRTSPTPWHARYEVGSSRHKYAFDILLAIRLARVLIAQRYDIIHGHLHEGALIGGLIGRLWGTPVCMDYQGALTDEMTQHGFLPADRPRQRAFWERIERLAERQGSVIFTSTEASATALRRRWPTKRIIALPDGVGVRFVRPDRLSAEERIVRRAALGIPPDADVAIFLGLLARHQGIDDILLAAQRLSERRPNLHWLVYGFPGVSGWRDRALRSGLADRVHFAGRVPYEQMPDRLALADLALAPKRSLTEGSGKILNYMAMGLPTVAYDTPAQRELLGELGRYAPFGDIAAFAEQVDALLEDRARWRELGRALRQRAENTFSWERGAETMIRAYRGILPASPHS